MRFLRFMFITIGIVLPNFAQAEPGPARGACMNDIKTLCGGVQPGGGRIRNCIKEHRAQLSQGCKMAIAERMMERRQNRQGAGGGLGKHDAE